LKKGGDHGPTGVDKGQDLGVSYKEGRRKYGKRTSGKEDLLTEKAVGGPKENVVDNDIGP